MAKDRMGRNEVPLGGGEQAKDQSAQPQATDSTRTWRPQRGSSRYYRRLKGGNKRLPLYRPAKTTCTFYLLWMGNLHLLETLLRDLTLPFITLTLHFPMRGTLKAEHILQLKQFSIWSQEFPICGLFYLEWW